jgi:hypothetical protein
LAKAVEEIFPSEAQVIYYSPHESTRVKNEKIVKPAQGKLLEHFRYLRKELIEAKILCVPKKEGEINNESESPECENGKNCWPCCNDVLSKWVPILLDIYALHFLSELFFFYFFFKYLRDGRFFWREKNKFGVTRNFPTSYRGTRAETKLRQGLRGVGCIL